MSTAIFRCMPSKRIRAGYFSLLKRTNRCAAVTIGWGEQDPWIPADQAAQLHDRLPGSSPVIMLGNAGTFAPVETPSRVSRALRDWLARSVTCDGKGTGRVNPHRCDQRGGTRSGLLGYSDGCSAKTSPLHVPDDDRREAMGLMDRLLRLD